MAMRQPELIQPLGSWAFNLFDSFKGSSSTKSSPYKNQVNNNPWFVQQDKLNPVLE